MKTPLIVCLVTILALNSCQSNRREADDIPPKSIPDDKSFSIPFEIIPILNTILIEGSVNGVKEKFMFDTGKSAGLTISEKLADSLKVEIIDSNKTITSKGWVTKPVGKIDQFSVGDITVLENDKISISDLNGLCNEFPMEGIVGYSLSSLYEAVVYDLKNLTLHFLSHSEKIEADDKMLVFDFKQEQHLTILTVEVHGVKKEFFFDTGAQMTMIGKNVVEELNLEVSSTFPYGDSTLTLYRVDSLALNGKAIMKDLELIAHPSIDAGFKEYDGLLGADFVHKFAKIVIDYKNSKMFVVPKN